MAKENTGWFSRYAWGVKVQWLKHLFLFFALRCCQGGLQTAPVKPWQLLSAKVLSEITGREEQWAVRRLCYACACRGTGVGQVAATMTGNGLSSAGMSVRAL